MRRKKHGKGSLSLVHSSSHPSFNLAAMEKKAPFLYGCEINAGVGRTGNEAR